MNKSCLPAGTGYLPAKNTLLHDGQKMQFFWMTLRLAAAQFSGSDLLHMWVEKRQNIDTFFLSKYCTSACTFFSFLGYDEVLSNSQRGFWFVLQSPQWKTSEYFNLLTPDEYRNITDEEHINENNLGEAILADVCGHVELFQSKYSETA